jgi:hypothetical protein
VADIIKLSAGQAFASAGFTAADFNSLANNSFVLASTAIDNSTNLDLWAELSGSMEVGGTTTAAHYLMLWLLPRNRDATTYGDGTPNGTDLPGSQYCVATGGVRVGITSGNAVFFTFRDILLPRGLFKWGISQHLGAALDSTAAFTGEFLTTNLNANG